MTSPENHLIALLPRKDRLRLLAACKHIELPLAEVLCDPGTPTRYVYFPTNGFVSLIAVIQGSPGVEVGMVGREGALGAQLALGVSQTHQRVVVQGNGYAWRISAEGFGVELERSKALQHCTSRYLFVLMSQLATSAACLRFHSIAPRLARWLLMTHDRAHCDTFDMKQDFLAYMLGVRRVGVTVAAGTLQKSGLIRYRRGAMTVLDRQGLEDAACSCYATNEALYARHKF